MEFEYSLKRADRKTIGITVKDGQVFVSAPKKAAIDSIQSFVNAKTEWIERKLTMYKISCEKFSEFAQYKSFLFFGDKLAPIFCNTKFISNDGDSILIPKKYLSLTDNSKLIAALKKFYKNLAAERLADITNSAAAQYGFNLKSVGLTNAKTKWGSCDGVNNIMLNWRLIFLSPKIIKYVVLHELCHTKEHNHSQSFWRLVQSFEPNYKKCKKELKEKATLINLFR